MIERQVWVEHKFNLGIHPGWHYNVVSRLRDTEIRIAHHTSAFSDELLSKQIDGKWSMKEQIGHLIDLEPLHSGRLDQFREMKAVLNMADMSNAKTEAADHNSRPVNELIGEFSQGRKEFIDNFYSLNDEVMQHQAEHPRLKVMMRPIDLMFFVAEHDEHHMVWIREIRKQLEEA